MGSICNRIEVCSRRPSGSWKDDLDGGGRQRGVALETPLNLVPLKDDIYNELPDSVQHVKFCLKVRFILCLYLLVRELYTHLTEATLLILILTKLCAREATILSAAFAGRAGNMEGKVSVTPGPLDCKMSGEYISVVMSL